MCQPEGGGWEAKTGLKKGKNMSMWLMKDPVWGYQ